MPRPERHVFVCLNERPVGGKPSCAPRGGAALFSALQRAVGARPPLWGRVAVTSCACLGPCFEGPNLVVYPEGVWYSGVAPADAEEIVEQHLAAGQPVERLVYRFPEELPPDPPEEAYGVLPEGAAGLGGRRTPLTVVEAEGDDVE